jgi:hypothetical protein
MRGKLPSELVLALRAPASTLKSEAGPLRFDAELERRFDWLLEAASALATRVLVLPTPADLAPGPRGVELLRALADRLPRDPARRYGWDPSGAWERDVAGKLARELGWVLAFDPLHEPVPEDELAYACLRALGGRRSFSAALLHDVWSRLCASSAREVYVSIDATRAHKHALELWALCNAHAS